ncbi:MAG: hypothetical protein WKG07_01480 [Hymenobacter sp.]
MAGPLAAQTTPPAAPPPAPNSANWYIFDKPLPENTKDEKAVDKEPKPDREARPVTTDAPAPAPPPQADTLPPVAPYLPPARYARPARAPYQGPLFVPLDPNTYRMMDRYAIKYGPDSVHDPHTSVRPYTRSAAAHLGERLLGGTDLSAADRFNAQYLVKDNWMFSTLGDSLNREPAAHPEVLLPRPNRPVPRADPGLCVSASTPCCCCKAAWTAAMAATVACAT